MLAARARGGALANRLGYANRESLTRVGAGTYKSGNRTVLKRAKVANRDSEGRLVRYSQLNYAASIATGPPTFTVGEQRTIEPAMVDGAASCSSQAVCF